MNMTTVPSDKLKEMQQEIASLKETIAQQAGSIEQLRDALHLAANNMTYVGAKSWDVVADALLLQPSPWVLQARDGRVAEACMNAVKQLNATKYNNECDRSVTWECAIQISSGEWRKYL